MICTLIGRFVLHCIDKAKRCEAAAVVHQLDLDRMSDEQISDLVHGRRVDVSNMREVPASWRA